MKNTKLIVQKHKEARKNGFAAMLTVLILSAVILIIVGTIALLSIGQGQAMLANTNGANERDQAYTCAEEALSRLRLAANYTGGTLSFPNGTTCAVTVSHVLRVYTLTVTTNDSTKYATSLTIIVTRANALTVSSWKEI